MARVAIVFDGAFSYSIIGCSPAKRKKGVVNAGTQSDMCPTCRANCVLVFVFAALAT